MGFYGNITNTNKTSFNFDKVYPNRYLMDQWATADGVFLGRYVLVEYDIETKKEDYSIDGIYPEDSAEGKTFYEINYLIDKTQYGTTSRLYDSTVWQKVYTDDGERYVMIAELNSVVPALRLTIDKPEEGQPGVPRFSEESNNIDYQLHWQPQWGFQVGKIEFNEAGFDKNNANAEVNRTDRIYFTKGQSNNTYPVYDTDPATGTEYIARMEKADDIQILNIDLPSIGNMVSRGYDVIYGENRKGSSGSLQGYLNFFTTEIQNNEIPVRSSSGAMIGATITDDAWINTTVNAASKNIQITHADAAKTKETATTTITGDTIDLYTPQVDTKGHVIGSITTTTTLPYGYKTIITNGVGKNKEKNESVDLTTENISAKNTVDTLALNSDNPWIRINTNAQNNTVTFAHSVNSVDEKDKSDTDLNADTATGTIRVYDIAHDVAGHITANQQHNYILPYGYKKINSGVASTSTDNGVSNSESIIANNAKDEFIIAPGNKWILTSANADSKTLTLAHEVHSIDNNPIEKHTTLDSMGGTITIKDIEFDNAGHAISNKNHVYDLPFAIRNISVSSSDVTTIGENSSGTITIEADKYNDTLNLSTQNRWITLKADSTTDTIVIGHAAANNANTTTAGAIEASTPKFGDTFTVPYVKYDGTGHIAENGNRTITIPKGSLEDKTSTTSLANVLTSIGFDAENGKITTEHQNVGKLPLTDFTTFGSLAIGNDTIKATDTINEAFGKIEYLLNQETTRATSAESTLSKQITDTVAGLNVPANSSDGYSLVSTVSESEGKISINVADVENIKLRTTPNTDNATSIQADDTLKAALGKLQAQVNSNKNSIETLTNGVDSDKVDSVTDLIQYVEEHGETTQGLIDAIGKQATDAESATGIYGLIDTEKEARDLADQNINKRIDELVKVTNDQISQWDKAEANVQADWNETDNTKDSFILNKPDNLVTSDQIVNMALKSDLNDVVKLNSQFEYIPSITNESTGEVTEAVMLTIQELMDKVRQLESRISELEKEEVPENSGTET